MAKTPTRERVGTELLQVLNATISVATSVHIGKLSDTALSLLHDSLIFEHDAHRQTNHMTGKKVPLEIREYFAAVKLETWCRHPQLPEPASPRYETRQPLDRLKAIPVHVQSNGTCSLADLQRQYWRQK